MTIDPRPRVPPQALEDAPALADAMWHDEPPAVTGVTLDSRRVQPGDLYAALPGAQTHGARFAQDAARLGAAAILTDEAGAELMADVGIPVAVVDDPRGVLGGLSAWIYGSPAEQMTMIGITGTNGKTTISYLLAVELAAGGKMPGVIGTIGIRIGGDDLPSARTTPESPDVHRLLAVMLERGVTAVVMEVSSHALALGRVDGIVFDLAMFTNLSQDHLDFHHDMEEYFAVKASLFTPERARRGLICVDDDWGRRLHDASPIPSTTYGMAPGAQWRLSSSTAERSGRWHAYVEGPAGQARLSCDLPGDFNHVNVLGSLAAAAEVGVPLADAARGVETFAGVPGRMERIPAPFPTFVDYAHTPEAVATVLAAARSFATGRILTVMGCGGDRDAGKRPAMGRVASMAADLVVVTDDNPRSEDPAVIRRQVLAGAGDGTAEVLEIGDRRSAIEYVVAHAEPDDVVLILGKGHEQGQETAGVVAPFDDREMLRRAVADFALTDEPGWRP